MLPEAHRVVGGTDVSGPQTSVKPRLTYLSAHAHRVSLWIGASLTHHRLSRRVGPVEVGSARDEGACMERLTMIVDDEHPVLALRLIEDLDDPPDVALEGVSNDVHDLNIGRADLNRERETLGLRVVRVESLEAKRRGCLIEVNGGLAHLHATTRAVVGEPPAECFATTENPSLDSLDDDGAGLPSPDGQPHRLVLAVDRAVLARPRPVATYALG